MASVADGVAGVARQARQGGFSLLELAVTASIAAILVVAGVPVLAEFAAETKVRSAASEVLLTLAQARNAAATHAVDVTLCPERPAGRCSDEADWASGWTIQRGSVDADGAIDEARVLARIRRAPDVEIRSTRRRIEFQPDGTAGGNNATFRICLPDSKARQRRVILSNAGRARVQVDPALGCPAPKG